MRRYNKGACYAADIKVFWPFRLLFDLILCSSSVHLKSYLRALFEISLRPTIHQVQLARLTLTEVVEVAPAAHVCRLHYLCNQLLCLLTAVSLEMLGTHLFAECSRFPAWLLYRLNN
jgi:hypothetical protein